MPRPETGSSITASVVFRLIEARKPTLLLDEADRILRSSNDELIAVLNSSHRRAGAFVWRTEEIAGQRQPVKFNTWSPCAFAGIRELPPTLQDRSIVIRLTRAKPGEVKEHLRHGTSPALRTIKRKFARWAADLTHLPDVPLPTGLHNRSGDNWQALLNLAALAGGRWPQLAHAAAVGALAADEQEGVLTTLLSGIKRAFGEQERLSTRAILDFLITDDEHDWTTANRGKVVNEAFLRERLRGVIASGPDGPGSERWGSGNRKERGYSRRRFLDAWQRYLPSSNPRNHPAQPAHPAPPLKTNENFGPDATEATRSQKSGTRPRPKTNGSGAGCEGNGTGSKNAHVARKKSMKSKLGPDGPDGPGDSGQNEKGMPINGDLGPEETL